MKRLIACFLVPLALLVTAAPAAASQPVKLRFSGCFEMRIQYPNGVAQSDMTAELAVRKGFYRPAVKGRVFDANARLDKDSDGVVCARRMPTLSPAQKKFKDNWALVMSAKEGLCSNWQYSDYRQQMIANEIRYATQPVDADWAVQEALQMAKDFCKRQGYVYVY